MSYATLREQCLKWNRSQQRWSTLVSGSDDMVPMEVDRIDGKGWNNQYGKKAKEKEERQGGKSKGKGKSKDGQKGKSKKGTEKGKSKADDRSKGKGSQTSSALHAGDMATIPRIVARSMHKGQHLSLVMQQRHIRQWRRDLHLHQLVEVTLSWPAF